ncbi:hypothetical protein [Streptomyces sp. SBT349]|uniref:hypothetical protein n=1 Tax=Streptomyces sp. SBT349 TaxID=1580539 RepID=UPI00066AD162|nr:hypothetical protein [Streptomyces sp. SBT349]
MATWHAQGVHLRAHAAALRAAHPKGAERVLTEPGWPALAATIDHADPVPLTHRAVAQRELRSAQSASALLLWRLPDLPRAGQRNDAEAARHTQPSVVPVPRAGQWAGGQPRVVRTEVGR